MKLTALGKKTKHTGVCFTKNHIAIHFQGPSSRRKGHSCVQQQFPMTGIVFLDMQEKGTGNAENEKLSKMTTGSQTLEKSNKVACPVCYTCV